MCALWGVTARALCAADEPAADVTVPGEFAGPLPDADPGAEELSVPGWLFPN